MMKLFFRFLLFLSLISLVSCTITKRKYTGGFYVNWHKKAPEAIRPHPTLSYEERGKSRPHRNRIVALSGQEKYKLGLLHNKISTTYGTINPPCLPTDKEVQLRVAAVDLSIPENSPSPMHVESVKARNRDNGLTGFEIGLLNIIDTALLIFFGHIGYSVFVLGFFLIFLFLFISGMIYSFMGLNRNDKHRGLGFLGILIEAGVLTALIIVG
jgi:hypothetical protein